jgi:hypothetical protein
MIRIKMIKEIINMKKNNKKTVLKMKKEMMKIKIIMIIKRK